MPDFAMGWLMSDFVFFPSSKQVDVQEPGQVLRNMSVNGYFPSAPDACGEPSCLPQMAAFLFSRAALPLPPAPPGRSKYGGVLLLPWHARTETVRFLYSKGMVLIHVDDAGMPWGAALFLELEALDPFCVGIWRKECK